MVLNPDPVRTRKSPAPLLRIATLAVFASALALVAPPEVLCQVSPKSSLKEKSSQEASSCKLRVEVTAGEKDEPVGNASVYVKFEQERKLAKDKKVEMNLKTNQDGVVVSPGVPRGKVLIQVVAPGWKTFGQWYEFDKDEVSLKIKLQKPPHWY